MLSLQRIEAEKKQWGIFSLGRPRRPHQRSAPPIKFRRLRQAVAYSVESLERRVLLSQYVVTDLGTLGGTSSNAYGINDSLQITGSASTATQSHAFLYSGGSMSDLGLFSGVTNSTSVAFGLNSGGQVVGLSYTGNQQVQHAFRDVGGTMFDIGTPGGLYSVARGINATGQIVGYGSTVGQGDASTGNYGIYHAFVYDHHQWLARHRHIGRRSHQLCHRHQRFGSGGCRQLQRQLRAVSFTTSAQPPKPRCKPSAAARSTRSASTTMVSSPAGPPPPAVNAKRSCTPSPVARSCPWAIWAETTASPGR